MNTAENVMQGATAVGSMRLLGDWVSVAASNGAASEARFDSGSLTEGWCEGSGVSSRRDMSRCKWRRVTLVRQMVGAARPIATRRNPCQCAKSPNDQAHPQPVAAVVERKKDNQNE